MAGLLAQLELDTVNHDLERGWTRTQVTSLPELRDPELLSPFKRAYLSSYTLSIRDTRERKIVGHAVGPGEISRTYLKRVLEGAAQGDTKLLIARKVPWRRDALQFTSRVPAYFFNGQIGGPFELVDIKACYASLYTRLSLDLTYRPECSPPIFGIGRGTFPDRDEWLKAKEPRNAVWGSVVHKSVHEWRNGTRIAEAFPNMFYAPDLMGIILDATHAIALEARENFGALSWAVDGGVFRPGEGQRFIEWLSSSWGLTAELRGEGLGWLFGPTSYAIGAVTTADVRAGRAIQWPETNALRPQKGRQRSWLADVFKERES